MNAVDAVHPFLSAGAGVEHHLAGFQAARENSHPGEIADVGIADDLKSSRTKGRPRVAAALNDLVRLSRLDTQNRRGQVSCDGIQQGLYAYAQLGRAAQDGHQLSGNDGAAQCLAISGDF